MAPRTPSSEVSLSLGLALVSVSSAPVLLLSKTLHVIAASDSFCKAFHINRVRAPGLLLSELGNGEWNVPQLAALLKATGDGFAAVDGYEMNLVRDGYDDCCLVIGAHKLSYAGQLQTQIILSINDVTAARRNEKRKDELLVEKDTLLKELHHRVANSLQIIASVLLQSARNVQSEETRLHLHDAHQRVMSVASLQQQLAASRVGDVELRPYFKALCGSIAASMIRNRDQLTLEVNADDSIATADTSVSLGLIVTELVINALKHAFGEKDAGHILVDYRAHGPNWTLSVTDNGIGMPADNSAKAGLGTSIVQALAKQLGAQVKVTSADPGTQVTIAHAFVPALVRDRPAV